MKTPEINLAVYDTPSRGSYTVAITLNSHAARLLCGQYAPRIRTRCHLSRDHESRLVLSVNPGVIPGSHVLTGNLSKQQSRFLPYRISMTLRDDKILPRQTFKQMPAKITAIGNGEIRFNAPTALKEETLDITRKIETFGIIGKGQTSDPYELVLQDLLLKKGRIEDAIEKVTAVRKLSNELSSAGLVVTAKQQPLVSPYSNISELPTLSKIQAYKKRPRITEAEKSKILQLLNEGKSTKDIIKLTGRSSTAIARHIRHLKESLGFSTARAFKIPAILKDRIRKELNEQAHMHNKGQWTSREVQDFLKQNYDITVSRPFVAKLLKGWPEVPRHKIGAYYAKQETHANSVQPLQAASA